MRPAFFLPGSSRLTTSDQRPATSILFSCQLSVVIITYNEEANIGRTLTSVEPLVSDGKGEIYRGGLRLDRSHGRDREIVWRKSVRRGMEGVRGAEEFRDR